MCDHDPGDIMTVHIQRVELQLCSREGYTTCSHLQAALVLPPSTHLLFLGIQLVECCSLLRVMLMARAPDNFCVSNLSSGKTFGGHGFRVILIRCYLSLSLKAEVLIPAGYFDPMQQQKSYGGHKQNPAGTQQLMQTKTLFPQFPHLIQLWSYMSACTEFIQRKEQCRKINGQRSTRTTSFNSDVNLPLLEVCEAKA